MTIDPTETPTAVRRSWLRFGWLAAIVAASAVHVWNALRGPLMRGWDDFGHAAYVLYLDLYRAIPWADQGWSFFHPPLHYLFGWALLELGGSEVLLRGLALLNGVASLGLAALAAAVTRRASGRPGLALVSFVSVAFLPVYLYTSPMAGNEITGAFLWTLGFAIVIANECRERPVLSLDACAGVAIGLGLLAKFTAVLALAAAGTVLLLRGLRAGRDAAVWRRVVLRGLVLGGTAVALASPYYARNVREFGTPFQMSRDHAGVADIEEAQSPGVRTWRDFVYVPATLLSDPHPQAEHLLHSVWGSAYAQMWADARGRLEFAFRPAAAREWERARSLMAGLGLVPTGLALAGALLAVRDLRRRRRVEVYGALFAIAGFTLGSFAWFAVAAPQFSALKASYLLGLTLPYAAFLARALEGLAAVAPRLISCAAIALVLLAAVAAGAVNASGVVVTRLPDHPTLALLRFHLGERQEAESSFHRYLRSYIHGGQIMRDNLAALALVSGRPLRALVLYLHERPEPDSDPFRWNAIGVASALAGHIHHARAAFEEALRGGAGAVALVNRGALAASLGDLHSADADLQRALELEPDLAPAWHNLSEALARAGRAAPAARARSRAERAAALAPRGYPYGIAAGLSQSPKNGVDLRFMLWLDGATLQLARAPFRARDALARVARAPAVRSARPHVVLIAIDALRADHLGAYGYERPTSPHIDALARDGIRFANAWAPSSWTLPSVASLFTSKLPSEHGATAWKKKIGDAPTVAEVLLEAGYRTLGVSGNFAHVRPDTGLARGFQIWRTLSFPIHSADADPLVELELEGRRLGFRAPSADEVNAEVLGSLPPADEGPLFLYVHYMEPHSGYDPPPAQRRAFATDPLAHAAGPAATSAYVTALAAGERRADAAERQRLIDLYDAEIAAVDAAIGELLEALRQRGYADDLVVAVVSDHGEEFAEHGGWFHGLTLHRESLAVPVVIRDFRRPGPGRVRDDPVDLLDVPTTLLGLAGVQPPPTMRGRALLGEAVVPPRGLVAELHSDPLFEESVRPREQRRTLLRWPWKILVERDGSARVYDVASDPHEQAPLEVVDPSVPRRVRGVARRLAKRVREAEEKGQPPATDPDVDPESREQLRALGYAE